MTAALHLGFIALTDSAPLIVAKERGLFADEGLDVTLHREVSWATIRDKVGAGLFQGAHMLGPMALAQALEAPPQQAFLAPLALNAHGAAIGVSRSLADAMGEDLSAARLAQVIAARGKAPTFAVVYHHSIHNYLLRHWAAAGGVDPDRDIRIVIAPPTAIAARLASGDIDGFCVGAPWGSFCETIEGARVVFESRGFWPGGPDKVLGVSAAWAEREPEQMRALTRAVLRAQMWADAPENAPALAQMLSARTYVGAPAPLIARRLDGASPTKIRFAAHATWFPWRSHAAWFLSQMLRWGQIPADAPLAPALEVYHPDLCREAAAHLGLSAPLADAKTEGAHVNDWALPGTAGPIAMSADRIFESPPFDHESLAAYAAGFAISRLKR